MADIERHIMCSSVYQETTPFLSSSLHCDFNFDWATQSRQLGRITVLLFGLKTDQIAGQRFLASENVMFAINLIFFVIYDQK